MSLQLQETKPSAGPWEAHFETKGKRDSYRKSKQMTGALCATAFILFLIIVLSSLNTILNVI